ncbi:hypothetical protein SY27_07755 [Flavobacterium sp. 316]|uniref:hypothetical protein n=1 Tax=Flavobacterium sp. 316 TaxID=1603293 RepID=UPI0005DFE624|nr:hypothetical protein [Flavobacterium sp. 316]KIX21584.1 hypothetical protein SY27_07755 [Flavobacterium sp. 316]
MNKTKIGVCKLCKKTKDLTYEHIPPKSAYNRNTKFYRLETTEYFKNAKQYVEGILKPKSRKEQGGVGDYCLCENCNGYLGSKYVRDYKKLSDISYSIISQYPVSKCYEYNISDVNLLKFIKQVIAIFICSNNTDFTENHKGLIEFVLDENSNNLPERYKVYMYLNDEGNIRSGNLTFTNLYGTICEFAFKPFGFVLSIDNPNPIMELSNITDFKKYNPSLKYKEIMIMLNKYPTIFPFPMDYRSLDEINNQPLIF